MKKLIYTNLLAIFLIAACNSNKIINHGTALHDRKTSEEFEAESYDIATEHEHGFALP